MSGARSAVRRMAHRAGSAPGVERVVRGLDAASRSLDRGAPATLAILTYHRIGAPDQHSDLAPTMVTTDAETFRSHMDTVLDVATPVSLRDLLGCIEGGAPLPKRSVLVTFDDGYRGFAESAWPILVEREIPAVMFVPTAYPSDPARGFWWDILWSAVMRDAVPPSVGLQVGGGTPMSQFRALRDRVLAAPREEADALVAEIAAAPGVVGHAGAVMDWSTLSDLAAEGLEVAAHTHTHAPLHKLSIAEARAEIELSIRELRDRGFGDAADVLAYPGGGHDDGVRAAAAAAGVRIAMTTERGVNRLDSLDRLRLRRINVGVSTSPAVLRAQLVPSLVRIRRWSGVHA